MWQSGWEGSLGGNGYIHMVWLSPFAVHLRLLQRCLLIGYILIQNKKFKKTRQTYKTTKNSNGLNKPVSPKGNQPCIFIGRTDAEAEAPVLWPPDGKSWLVGQDPDAGRDWGQEEKGMTEDEMAGWHQWLNGREFEQALGDGDGQGGLACCSLWGAKSRTRQSSWTTTLRTTQPQSSSNWKSLNLNYKLFILILAFL